MSDREVPYKCAFCGAPSYLHPADQTPPPAYCHPEDHGSEQDIADWEGGEEDII